MIASQRGFADMVEVLLRHRAQVDMQDKVCVHSSQTKGMYDYLMLTNQRYFNCYMKNGSTALLKAAEFGHKLVVAILLEHNACVYTQTHVSLILLFLVVSFLCPT